jgi:hypothetical protein
MAKKFSDFIEESGESLTGSDFFAGYRSGINNIRANVDSIQEYFFQNLQGLNGINYPESLGDSGNIIASDGASFQSVTTDSLGLVIGPVSSNDGGLVVFSGISGNNIDDAPIAATASTLLGYLNSGQLGNIQLGTNLSLDNDGFLNASGGGGGGISYNDSVLFSGPWATNVATNIYLSKSGTGVTLLLSNLLSTVSGSTNPNNIVGTAVIPSAYRPPITLYADIIPVRIDGVVTFQTGRVSIDTAGTITISTRTDAPPTSPISFWEGTSGVTTIGAYAFGIAWSTES